MTTLKQADYLSIESSVITTGLNSLADAASAESAEIDNTSGNATHGNALSADFIVDLASLNITSAAAFMSLYLVPTVDGTNYPWYVNGSSASIPAQYFVGNLAFLARNGTQMQELLDVPLPAGKFKAVLLNRLGLALAASGNTLKMRRRNLQSV